MRFSVFAALLVTAARYGPSSGKFGGHCTPSLDLSTVASYRTLGTTHTVVDIYHPDSDTSTFLFTQIVEPALLDRLAPVDASTVPVDTSLPPLAGTNITFCDSLATNKLL